MDRERKGISLYINVRSNSLFSHKSEDERDLLWQQCEGGKGGIPQPSYLNQCPKPPRFKTPKRLQNKWSFVIQNKLCNRTFKKTIESLTQGLGVMSIVIWHLAFDLVITKSIGVISSLKQTFVPSLMSFIQDYLGLLSLKH